MSDTIIRPSECLLNETVGSGWKVIKKREKFMSRIDGQYSVGYIVQKEGEPEAYLKAVDLFEAFSKVQQDIFKVLEKITKRANNEKEIAKICSDFRMKNVVRFIEAGEFQTSSKAQMPIAHFIIYEKAEKDGLQIAEEFGVNMSNMSIYQRLNIVHNTANALRAMHAENITHQDPKPSNVLMFKKGDANEVFKIGDFDCAIRKTSLTLMDELENQEDSYAGTYRYAPIELLYDHVVPIWEIVRKGTDFYLLGSLICYYFTGRSMTELFYTNLGRSLSWQRAANVGKYNEILPRAEEAFEICIEEVAKSTAHNKDLQKTLCQIIRTLCHPDPLKRGEKKISGSNIYTLTLLPTVSRLGNLRDYFKGL